MVIVLGPPGALPTHEISDFGATPGGTEAGVKGPGAGSSRIHKMRSYERL
jgi:hypothetical protein